MSSSSPLIPAEKDNDEGILVQDEAGNSNNNNNEQPRDQRDEAEKESSSAGSVIGDITLFRDFFLAAFSDGYYSVACCGSEGLFPGGGDYCVPGRNSSARVAPLDVSSHSSYRDVRKTASSRSQHSHDNLQLKASSSYSSGAGTPAQRKRPLALAVGFKYAEDVNGRPIVITPGNHRRPPVVVNSNRGPSTSPVHHHHHSPNKRDSFIVPPTAADVLFPLDLDPDAPRHQQQHLCYKPGISS